MKVVIITDKTATLNESFKEDTIFNAFSGSFKEIRTLYEDLRKNKINSQVKIYLGKDKVIDSSKNYSKLYAKKEYQSVTDVLREYNPIIILLTSGNLISLMDAVKKSGINLKNKKIFLAGGESLKERLAKVFDTKNFYFYKRPGVTRLGKEHKASLIKLLKRNRT